MLCCAVLPGGREQQDEPEVHCAVLRYAALHRHAPASTAPLRGRGGGGGCRHIPNGRPPAPARAPPCTCLQPPSPPPPPHHCACPCHLRAGGRRSARTRRQRAAARARARPMPLGRWRRWLSCWEWGRTRLLLRCCACCPQSLTPCVAGTAARRHRALPEWALAVPVRPRAPPPERAVWRADLRNCREGGGGVMGSIHP